MNTPEFQFATRAAVFALQCSALLDRFHKNDPNSTGFHALAARTMAKRALAALDAVAENPADVRRIVEFCDEAAESSANILRAYLSQRNEPRHDDAGH